MYTTEDTDHFLLSRIANGDEAAYSALFRRYFDRLKWHATRIVKSEFWAEEIVQETFLKLWEQRKELSTIENASAYLFRMAGNRSLNRIARQKLEIEMQYVASAVLHGRTEVLQSNKYDLKKIEDFLQQAIDNLPAQRRAIYQLQQQGLSYQAIADQLGISRNTVRNQMAQALITIRAKLSENGPFALLLFSYLHSR